MIFDYAEPYGGKGDMAFYGDFGPELERDERIEEPIHPLLTVGEIGETATEGQRFGSLIQSSTGAIRGGASKIELQTNMGGGVEAVGAEAYGHEARQTLREVQRATGAQFTSVHVPTQIGNLSGFNPQQGFSDEQRLVALEEVKKAITFAAETAGKGAIVIHTGEYQRPMSEQQWAKNSDGTYQFLGYQEEPGRAITYMVDDRNGRIISDVRKSQIIREPVYLEAESDYVGKDIHGNPRQIDKGDWVDQDGQFIDPKDPEGLFKRVPQWDEAKTRFKTRAMGWEEIAERANKQNKKYGTNFTPEEMAYRIQMETQMLQYRGSSLYHGKFYDGYREQRVELLKHLEYYEQIEKDIPPEEAWKIMKTTYKGGGRGGGEFATPELKLPSEVIKKELDLVEKEMRYTHEASSSADAQADQIQDTLEHVKPVDKYAVDQSMKSYAEAGIHAMQQSEVNPHAKGDLFVAPENIFPEMGFGSHPQELKQLVLKARDAMVQYLTEPELDDIYARRKADGTLPKKPNPFFNPDMTKERAAEEAKSHIKATLDTQHMGMWRKHFQAKPGEVKQDTDKRFSKWYMDEFKQLADDKIIGHVHLVDSLGGGHHHLPAGQGDLPLRDAMAYLKDKGYDVSIISEAFGEEGMGAGRIRTKTWQHFGSPVYSAFSGPSVGPAIWPQVQQGYFGRTQPPLFIYGSYSPSNDWTLWTQVPME